jgi:tetratricopeptide (TPR) repeat protein
MLTVVEEAIEARTSRYPNSDEKPRGPYFTFLIGAGFSVTAGVSSVEHLVLSLEEFKNDRKKSWFEIFDECKGKSLEEGRIKFDEITDYYFSLIEEILPLPQSRHDFITAAIQWASSRKVQINIESILLATLLMAGTGGPYSKSSSGNSKEWLARSFAKHVFTTNFDEVMPTTFYFGNQPVDIIDRATNVNLLAEYPTLVYLHGRHLHFKMRNTKSELHSNRDQDERDLMVQFRDVLRNTGLIVIGYAGANDQVSQAILDAIDDPESLPYGLWWCSYKQEENSIHDDLLQSIRLNDRSFVLEQGKDAEQVMRSLTRGLGIDDKKAIGVWKDRLTVISGEVNRFIDRSAYDFGAFNVNLAQALLFLDDTSLNAVLEEWNELKEFLLEHEDKSLVIDILGKVSKLLIATESYDDFDRVINRGIEYSRINGDELHEAYFLLDQGEYLMSVEKHEHATLAINNALKILETQSNKVGSARAYTMLVKNSLKASKVESAQNALKNLEGFSIGSENIIAIADYYQVLGEIQLVLNELDNAEHSFKTACEKHEIAGDQRDVINDKIGLIKCSEEKGDSDSVGKLINEVRSIAKILDNRKYWKVIKDLERTISK